MAGAGQGTPKSLQGQAHLGCGKIKPWEQWSLRPEHIPPCAFKVSVLAALEREQAAAQPTPSSSSPRRMLKQAGQAIGCVPCPGQLPSRLSNLGANLFGGLGMEPRYVDISSGVPAGVSVPIAPVCC